MTAVASSASSKPSSSTSWQQVVRQYIDELIKEYFSGTLGKVNDITNIVMALIYKESTFRPNTPGPTLSLTNSSIARDYWNSPAITSARGKAPYGSQQAANINEGLRAWGLMQCGGWNLVRGASKAGGGKTEIEKARPDLAPQLMVGPGESIQAKIDGEQNARLQILAGLIMLESKWKQTHGSGLNWKIGRLTFNSQISGAVAGYLGLGRVDTKTGITPQAYSNSIVYGSAYKVANNGASSVGYQSASNNSSQKVAVATEASGKTQVTAGC